MEILNKFLFLFLLLFGNRILCIMSYHTESSLCDDEDKLLHLYREQNPYQGTALLFFHSTPTFPFKGRVKSMSKAGHLRAWASSQQEHCRLCSSRSALLQSLLTKHHLLYLPANPPRRSHRPRTLGQVWLEVGWVGWRFW